MKKTKKPTWYTGFQSLLGASHDNITEYLAYCASLPLPKPQFKNNGYYFTSRYGNRRSFILENGAWYFEGEKLNDYMRIGYKTDASDPDFIDPEGGPFLQKGTEFRNHVSVLPEHNMEITGFEKSDNRWLLKTVTAKEAETAKPSADQEELDLLAVKSWELPEE